METPFYSKEGFSTSPSFRLDTGAGPVHLAPGRRAPYLKRWEYGK